jgi:hypothetical protein
MPRYFRISWVLWSGEMTVTVAKRSDLSVELVRLASTLTHPSCSEAAAECFLNREAGIGEESLEDQHRPAAHFDTDSHF